MTRSALALLLVLGLATSASADGAWIMWSHASTKGQSPQRHAWTIMDAFPSLEACREAKFHSDISPDLQAFIAGKAAEGFTVQSVCLPETFNPQRPATP